MKELTKHFKERARTRLGLILNDEEIKDVVDQIQGRDDTFVESQSSRRKVHKVVIRGTPDAPGWPEEVEALVVYDTVLSTVVTCGKFLEKEGEEWVWH